MVLPLQCGSGPAALLLPKWAVRANAERKELQTELNRAKSEVQPAPSGNAQSEPGQLRRLS
jgi:hypothetical protein